jgi:hypothetical protein
MRFLCLLFSLALSPLAAQPNSGSWIVDFGAGITDYSYVTLPLEPRVLVSDIKYAWQITRAENGDKTFNFVAYGCVHRLVVNGFGNDILYLPLPLGPVCTQLSQSTAEVVGPIDAAMAEFYNLAPGKVAHNVVYGPFSDGWKPRASVVQAAEPTSPQMIMLDGLSYDLLKFDLTSYAILARVTVPSTNGPFGVRPNPTGPANEVWVANGGKEVSIADLGTQTLVTNIPTPSILQVGNPTGIVFTNSGATALEAFKFYSPDADGNTGALLVFDAANRKLTSTMLLKYAPTTLLMAPDGLTAYLLDDNGKLVYYDVLSGTADLTTRTDTPGVAGGFSSLAGKAFVHPDGTRLFWNANTSLYAFDLNKRKLIYQVSSGLPTTSAASMQPSQDGSTVWFANAAGNVSVVDTRYGNIMTTYQTEPGSQVFPGPSN